MWARLRSRNCYGPLSDRFGRRLIAAITAQVVGMTQNGTVWPAMAFVIGFTVLSRLILRSAGAKHATWTPVRARVHSLQPGNTRGMRP